MKKCLMVKDEQTAVKVNIHVGAAEIEGVEYVAIKCPTCKTVIYIPNSTIQTLLVSKRKKLTGVV